MDQNSEDGSGRGFRGGAIALTLMGALAFYVVMLGPAVYVYDSCPRPVQAGLEYVYAPLEFLDQQLPGRPISRYVEAWQ